MKNPFPRWNFNRYFSVIILVAAINISVGTMYLEGQASEITVLGIEGAPQGIVFIADPHLKEGTTDHIRAVIQEINALQPSVVLIGGDFVYEDGENFTLQEVWKDLDAPVYAVLGNHDYKAGITAQSAIQKMSAASGACLDPDRYDVSCYSDPSTDFAYADRLTEALEENGVHVLRNEYVTMNPGGKDLLLVGVDDGWAGMSNPPVLPDSDAFVLYMIHEPGCRADWDSDLILAGHTHGGQFLPKNLTIGGVEMSGLIERNGTDTYITRGIGTSNLEVELRLFATPEIVIINPVVPPESVLPESRVTYIHVE
jgi:predicted MPP superfamily phosphohydrolase